MAERGKKDVGDMVKPFDDIGGDVGPIGSTVSTGGTEVSEHLGSMNRLGQEGIDRDLPQKAPPGTRPSTPDNVAPARDERFGEAAKK